MEELAKGYIRSDKGLPKARRERVSYGFLLDMLALGESLRYALASKYSYGNHRIPSSSVLTHLLSAK